MNDYETLFNHLNHNICIVYYGIGIKDIRNMSLECKDCNEVIESHDKEE